MFNVVPVRGRYLLVSAWYEGGVAAIDFTDTRRPREIAWFEAGAPRPSDVWSAYWYNGLVYASDISRGLVVLSLAGTAARGAARLGHVNPQTQDRLLR